MAYDTSKLASLQALKDTATGTQITGIAPQSEAFARRSRRRTARCCVSI